MNSPCITEASEACFHGCCSAPAFALHSPKSTTSTTSTTTSISQYHFRLATLSSLPNITQYFTNHESLPSLQESFSYFINAYPQYSQTRQADQVRSQEYYHLNHVCLDYIGHGLFSYSQQELQRRRFTSTANDPSMASSSTSAPLSLDFPESHFFDICYKAVSLKSQLVFNTMSQEPELESKMRKRMTAFMNISEDDYTMVFTSNQSSAFKLLSESYPFQSNRNLLTVYDFKSEAVEAMTESSKRRGARVNSAEFSWPNMRIQTRKLRKMIIGSSSSSSSNKKKPRQNKGLFVFPLQSRMTGSRYSYLWMSMARENGWHVLLDACALGPKDMETLGLSLFQPDFLICSFYKVFGENPSGFGCLFVKKTSSSILNDSSTAMSIGIVSLVPSSSSNFDDQDLEPVVKDGSLASSKSEEEIVELEKRPSVKKIDECRGLDHADSLGLVLISARARFLINWLVNALTRLQHPNSETGMHSLVRIYGPKLGYDRGPSVAFNVFDWKGEKVNPALVQKLADRNNISLSCGVLQNLLFEDKNEEERERRLEACDTTKTTIDTEAKRAGFMNKERVKFEGCGISALTATIGLMTNFEDIYRLWVFVARFLDADFVEKERWRYMALNQTTIEV